MRTIAGFADFYKGIHPIAYKFSAVVQGILKTKKTATKTSIIVCFVSFPFFLGSDNFATMYLLHL